MVGLMPPCVGASACGELRERGRPVRSNDAGGPHRRRLARAVLIDDLRDRHRELPHLDEPEPDPASREVVRAPAPEEPAARDGAHLVVELRPADPSPGVAEADELDGVGRDGVASRGWRDHSTILLPPVNGHSGAGARPQRNGPWNPAAGRWWNCPWTPSRRVR